MVSGCRDRMVRGRCGKVALDVSRGRIQRVGVVERFDRWISGLEGEAPRFDLGGGSSEAGVGWKMIATSSAKDKLCSVQVQAPLPQKNPPFLPTIRCQYLFTPSRTVILGPNAIFESLALSNGDLIGGTAVRVLACILGGYIEITSRVSSTKVPTPTERQTTETVRWFWKMMSRRRTSAAWSIRLPAMHPNDGFGAGRSACYGAGGGEPMVHVGGAVGV